MMFRLHRIASFYNGRLWNSLKYVETPTHSIKGRQILTLMKNRISNSNNPVVTRYFHTTSIRPAAPLLGPVLVKLMAPIYRFLFLFMGRRFRKWWRALPKEQKNKYIYRLMKNRMKLLGVFGIFGGLSVGYYTYHLEETPITGRKRLMLLNKDQLLNVIEVQTRNITLNMSAARLPSYDSNHIRVYKILKRIFESNNLDDVNLLTQLSVINTDDVNAFVLADGQIFVFTGMINAAVNDDELAGVLGHELSHALLNHSAEQLSRSGYINIFSIIVFTLLWAVIPSDGLSILCSWFQGVLEDILISLPYSRKLEKEADEVGMMLAAKACYDVNQISKFWERMHTQEESEVVEQNDWLSTHPSHDKRVVWLNENLPKALAAREEMKCPRLTRFYEEVKNMKSK